MKCYELIWILVYSTISTNADKAVVVDTDNGKIHGRLTQTVQDPEKYYYAFRGIPYARPPLGNLRFQAPVKPNPWHDELKIGEKYGKICTQYDVITDAVTGSEDCLFLNVFTNNLHLNSCSNKVASNEDSCATDDKLLPVMFFIHGGAYVASSSVNYGPDYLMEKPVVLVTINYRLDIFGFLTTMDHNAFGNLAFKDQIAALEWVRDNIAKFGGDPNKVTIFGQSAGAHSLSILRLSPRSKGLFHQMIAESCSALSYRHLQRNPLKYVHNIARHFNISTESSENIVKGLQKIKKPELIRAANNPEVTGFNENFGPFPFYPVVEIESPEAIITKPPYQLLEESKFTEIPYISGHNTKEGTFGLTLIRKFRINVEDYDSKYEMWSSPSFNNKQKQTEIGELVREFFLANASAKCTENFLEYLSQDMYVRAIRKEWDFLRKHASSGYFYRFSYKGSTTAQYAGTGHAEELQYIFYLGEDLDTMSNDDVITRRRLVELWTNFAIYGDPTPRTNELLQNISWPKSRSSDADLNFLDIGQNLTVGTNPLQESYEFWKKLFADYGIPPFETY